MPALTAIIPQKMDLLSNESSQSGRFGRHDERRWKGEVSRWVAYGRARGAKRESKKGWRWSEERKRVRSRDDMESETQG